MVATVGELLAIVRSNPFIDGIGYFVEINCSRAVPEEEVQRLDHWVKAVSCEHSQVTVEIDKVLGVDFHDHILVHDDEDAEFFSEFEKILLDIEAKFGVDHICLELQFDLASARKARSEVDELLKP